MDKVRKVAIYTRVSTDMQVDKDSLPMQRDGLVAYAKLVLNIDSYEIFEDAGFSGKNTDRPAYQDMMRRVRLGEFSHILVWKIDRISRNLIDFANMYQELKGLGVSFVSKNEQFQTDTAMGEAMLKIILVFAELERNMTSERVTATMVDRASKGIWNGGRIPFGYDYDYDNRVFFVREDEAAVVREIYDLYLERKSIMYVVKRLDAEGHRTRAGMQFSATGIDHILRSDFYIGTYTYNRFKGGGREYVKDESDWVICKDHHPAIISEDQHRQVGQILDINVRYLNTPGSRVRKNVHVFGGMMYCGKCGRAMHSTPGRLSPSGYRPTKYNCPAIRKGNTCDNSYVNDNVVGEFVLNLTLNILNSQKLIDDNANESSLQQMLLKGDTFKNVWYIGGDGLSELLDLLAYPSDGSSVFKPHVPKEDASSKTDTKKIRAEKLKIERALDRLKKLYLYSDEGMSETEYIIERSKLTDQLAEYDQALDDIAKEAVSRSIDDEDFIRTASQFIISQQLQNKPYVSYRRLASAVEPIVLRNFFDGIIDSISVTDSQVTGITFRNGLYLSFVYKSKEPSA